MVDIHIKNGEIFVKSEYDRNIVTFMRSRPKRFWNTTTREWKLPESDLDLLIASLSDYEYNIRYDDDSNSLNHDLKNNTNMIQGITVSSFFEITPVIGSMINLKSKFGVDFTYYFDNILLNKNKPYEITVAGMFTF